MKKMPVQVTGLFSQVKPDQTRQQKQRFRSAPKQGDEEMPHIPQPNIG